MIPTAANVTDLTLNCCQTPPLGAAEMMISPPLPLPLDDNTMLTDPTNTPLTAHPRPQVTQMAVT
jgi:hypothetical protein